VAAPEPRLVAETDTLVRALAAIDLRIGGIVVNRALPRALFGTATPPPAPPTGVSPTLAARLRRSYQDLRTLAAHQEAALAPLVATGGAPVVATLGLENPLPAPRERLGAARIREHSPGKPREPLPAEAVYPLQDGLALRTPVPALAL